METTPGSQELSTVNAKEKINSYKMSVVNENKQIGPSKILQENYL